VKAFLQIFELITADDSRISLAMIEKGFHTKILRIFEHYLKIRPEKVLLATEIVHIMHIFSDHCNKENVPILDEVRKCIEFTFSEKSWCLNQEMMYGDQLAYDSTESEDEEE
jgi:hypothetical protein